MVLPVPEEALHPVLRIAGLHPKLVRDIGQHTVQH